VLGSTLALLLDGVSFVIEIVLLTYSLKMAQLPHIYL